jgi:hypothetical protein
MFVAASVYHVAMPPLYASEDAVKALVFYGLAVEPLDAYVLKEAWEDTAIVALVHLCIVAFAMVLFVLHVMEPGTPLAAA